MKKLLLVLVTLLFASMSSAEEYEPYGKILVRGVICDTKEQVETLLTNFALRKKDWQVEGCGQIRGTAFVVIQPLYWYETPPGDFFVAQFTYANGWVQFGFIDIRPNPDYQPVVGEPT